MGVARNLPRRRRARGMAMVEMVFVLPVLLLLVFGIAEISLMFSRWLTLISAVHEGARTASLFRGSACDENTVAREVRSTVRSYAAAGGVALADTDIAVSAIPGICARGATATVKVARYPFPLHIPFASSLGTIDLHSESSMQNE